MNVNSVMANICFQSKCLILLDFFSSSHYLYLYLIIVQNNEQTAFVGMEEVVCELALCMHRAQTAWKYNLDMVFQELEIL